MATKILSNGLMVKYEAGEGIKISNEYVNKKNIEIKPATTETLGGVKQGDNIVIGADGTISAKGIGTTYTAGDNITIENGWVVSENLPENLDIKKITYGNGLYVAIGNYSLSRQNQKPGVVLTSKNGKDWATNESPSDHPLMGIAFGNGKYVLTSEKEVFTCSEVNIEKGNWTKKIEVDGETDYFWNVLFGNGNFVVLSLMNPGGGEGIESAMAMGVITSIDGDTWEESGINNNAFIDPIFRYSNGEFFIGGTHSPYPFNPIVLHSKDGRNYEEIYKSEFDLGGSLSEVAYNGREYIVVSGNVCYIKTEESDWQSYGAINYKSIISAGNKFMAFKKNNEIYKSANGITWEKAIDAPNRVFNEIVYENNTLILLGNSVISENNDYSKGIISAVDTTYTAGDNVTIDESNRISAVDTTYTAGDNVTIDESNRISAVDTVYTAGDNINIDENNIISAVDTTYAPGDNINIDYRFKREAEGVVINDFWGAACGRNTVGQDVLVAVGRGGAILVSENDRQWEQRGDLSQANLFNEVTYWNGKFIVVGGGKDQNNQQIEKGVMYISSDGGNTWSPQIFDTLSDTTNLYEIKHVNNQFIAVGSKGMIMMSRDGDTWNKQPTGVQGAETLDLHGIAYGETVNGSPLYVIPAYKGVVLTSENGENWQKQSIPDIARFYDAEYGVVNGQGLFVLVGNNSTSTKGVIMTSKTGAQGSWERTEITGITIQGISYKNGFFMAAGTSGTLLTSYDGKSWIKQVLPGNCDLWGIAYNNTKILISGLSGSIFVAPINPLISATDTTYTAGDNITIDGNNRISAVDTTYTAGDNITIDKNNKISATGTTYTLPPATAETLGGVKQGQNIVITSDGTISAMGFNFIYKTQIALSQNGWQYHGNDIYSQHIHMEHFVAKDSAIIIDIILDEAPDGDYTMISKQLLEWDKVKGRKLYNGGIYLYSYSSAPEIDLNINIQII